MYNCSTFNVPKGKDSDIGKVKLLHWRDSWVPRCNTSETPVITEHKYKYTKRKNPCNTGGTSAITIQHWRHGQNKEKKIWDFLSFYSGFALSDS